VTNRRFLARSVPSFDRCTAHFAPIEQLTLTGSDTLDLLCSISPTPAGTRVHSLK